LKFFVSSCDSDDRYPKPSWVVTKRTTQEMREGEEKIIADLLAHPLITSTRQEIMDAQNWKRFGYEKFAGATRLGYKKQLTISFPHWLPVFVFGLLAMLIRPKPRFGFRLYDLLAVTTIVAAVVGGYAALLRLAEV
jgi:hypothetical protein